jgi:hypothetical protein
LNLESTASVVPPQHWSVLATVTLSNSSQIYPDSTQPVASQEFYRTRQTGSAGGFTPLGIGLVTGISLSGAVGDIKRLDYINQTGPTNGWVNLATVALTNTSQLYFDFSAVAQPPRLYRVTQGP